MPQSSDPAFLLPTIICNDKGKEGGSLALVFCAASPSIESCTPVARSIDHSAGPSSMQPPPNSRKSSCCPTHPKGASQTDVH